jgi:hypothetical protein
VRYRVRFRYDESSGEVQLFQEDAAETGERASDHDTTRSAAHDTTHDAAHDRVATEVAEVVVSAMSAADAVNEVTPQATRDSDDGPSAPPPAPGQAWTDPRRDFDVTPQDDARFRTLTGND